MNAILKSKKLFMAVISMVMVLTGCNTSELDLSPVDSPAVPANCPAVEFSSVNQSVYEKDPAAPEFTVKVQRKATDAATYDIKVLENQDNSFIIPASVSFAAGETAKDITISTKPDAATATPLKFAITFDEAAINPYTEGLKSYTATVTLIAWENLGIGYWVGNIMNAAWGVQVLPLAVKVEKAVTKDGVKFRFDNPYRTVAYDEDELGYFGYPYNEEADLTGTGDEKIFIDLNGTKAILKTVEMGMDWGYGALKFGQIYGNLSTSTQYPLGTFTQTATGGNITFPAGSLFLNLPANGNYICKKGDSVLYLSAADFIASMEE